MDIKEILEIVALGGKTLAELVKAWKGSKDIGTRASPLLSFPLPARQRTRSFLIGRKKDLAERKKDIAIAIQVNQFLGLQVKEFLEKEKTDANLILITNSLDIQELKKLDNDKPEEWREVISDFNKEIENTQRIFGATTFHIFLASPSALAIALGAALGRQRRAYVYHWDPTRNTYAKIAVLPKDIK